MAIVGAGPVGLLLACLLSQRGIEVRVLERLARPSESSRAIGVHPPGLDCLREAGVADRLVQRGVRVRRGRALCRGQVLGEIAFQTLPPPYDFVLSVPQVDSERLLTERLQELNGRALQRDVEVLAIGGQESWPELVLGTRGGQARLRAQYVVGCDGKQSLVRKAMQVEYVGAPYRQSFVMGDFHDGTDFGADAAVFLSNEGLVESFPLPGFLRRWVLGTGATRVAPDASVLAALIERRTGQRVQVSSMRTCSGFTAERYRAPSFVRGKLLLAGDAAHVLSPIGGQGMNLGWLDARMLADALTLGLHDPASAPRLLADYGHRRQRAARAATRRAELFMALGCATGFLGVRRALLKALLSRRVAPAAAQLFTMRGLVT